MWTENKKRLLQVLLAFAAVYIIWGTTYLALRVAVESMPAFLMSGVRFVSAGLILFLILRFRGAPNPQRLHVLPAIIVGTLLLFGGSGLVAWAEKEIPSGIAALVIATMPIWMALLGWLFFGRSRPGKRVGLGLLLGFVGMALLIGPEQFTVSGRLPWFSMFVLLLAPILWSIGSLYTPQANLPADTFMSTAMQMLAAGILLLLAGLLTGEASQLDFAAVSLRSLAALAYLILLGSVIAFTAFAWLLQNVPPTKVATYAYVNPVIAVFLGSFILDERITPLIITDVFIIVLAVILITTFDDSKQIVNQKTAVSADLTNPELPLE